MNKLHTLTCSSRLIWQANRVTVGRADGNSTACQREFQLGRVLSSRESLRFLGFNWAWRTSLPQLITKQTVKWPKIQVAFYAVSENSNLGSFSEAFRGSYERLHESHLIRSPTLVGKQQACGLVEGCGFVGSLWSRPSVEVCGWSHNNDHPFHWNALLVSVVTVWLIRQSDGTAFSKFPLASSKVSGTLSITTVEQIR